MLLPLALLACGTVEPTVRHTPADTQDTQQDGEDVAPFRVTSPDLVLLPGDSVTVLFEGGAGCTPSWSSSAEALVGVDATGLVTAHSWGAATVTARCGEEEDHLAVTVAEEELRGLWVTRWTYHSAQDVRDLMDAAVAVHANAVYFQVRGRNDAFYTSSYEPWASELSGTLGADPGWDPLEVAVEEGHARGLQVHAYLNTFPFWSGTTPPASTGVPHPYSLHPDWVVDDGSGPMALNSSYVFASPGAPAVRAHIVQVVTEVATNYDVDGIHMDYVRYPGHQYSHDDASEAAWGGVGDYGDWQRQQILGLLLSLQDAVEQPLSAAVWGIYENSWGWSGVSQGNVDYYQDTRAFMAEGALDAAMPMIYWPVTATPGDRLDFRTLARDHVQHAAGRHIYTGIDATALTPEQVVACVEAARSEGAQGQVLFELNAAKGAAMTRALVQGPWANPAVPPQMGWR
ncbi:MAG: family 10 glycosylhydrolase [Deltaproteobacteria bacterium]|nr:family 10 glycosylhydrolase [Deltaproteobacteria bacterium]